MNTNANSTLIAAIMKDSRYGSFTGLVTTKKGKEVGKGADKKVYGNDQVHVLILTGFKYDGLVRRSLEQLPNISADDVIAALAEKGHTVTEADVEEARNELSESYNKSLSGTNVSTTDHVFEPLVVDGETVRGSRVYKCVKDTVNVETNELYECKCRNCNPGDLKAPLPGTVYLQGLQIKSTVLVPGPNGKAPEPKSAPKTLAKNELTKKLPISKYVQYTLEPGQDWILHAGGTAAIEATKKGFVVTDEIVSVLAKAA